MFYCSSTNKIILVDGQEEGREGMKEEERENEQLRSYLLVYSLT